ncbi:hypothetical protein PP629_gp41 [Streptomyces phage Dubu]|uniref:Uncharacterized protein n=1 Tax=Streptomyces phage Dubu TaxID=2591226 RepID=A0A514DEV9_9CAUD|nr:hypothetical protein PP629_gp41 [Streptomyces phage Dubu]QDH92146.1 hypothetical protein SEA_DUBU_41 [Streptomyces phage Dubu]
MKLEYLILTTSGPAVGEATVNDRDEACDALEAAVKDAFGDKHTEDHTVAVRSICRELRASELPFSFRTTAVTVTLKP